MTTISPPCIPFQILILISLKMPSASLFKLFEPLLLFDDEKKTIGDLVKLFEDIHTGSGAVLEELRQLDDDYGTSVLVNMDTFLPACQIYSLSVGLLRLADASLTLQSLFLKDAAGLEPSQTMLSEAEGRVKAVLESHLRKYKVAKEDYDTNKDEKQVRILNSFIKRIFPM